MRPAHPRDPIGLTIALTALFLALCSVRLTVPSTPFFDEVHYLPAARALLDLSYLGNPEHPPLGKELMALGIALFGDKPLGWRLFSVALAVLGLFAAMRAMWFGSGSRFVSLATGVLLVTAFPLLVHARIAMLDGIMAGFLLIALWMCAGALRENETARWRLVIAGAALGAAMATKWNAIPLAVLPGLAFLAVRVRLAGWDFLLHARLPPVRGMSLLEAGLWLGLLPLAVYFLSFLPFAFLKEGAVEPSALFELQHRMLSLQERVVEPHTYQSVWYEWVLNLRAIWYLYEPIDGAHRGVMLIGNPLTVLLGLPAMMWCAWAGLARKRGDALAVVGLYVISLGMWIVAPKPVQFYYHYLLPSCFLMAGLALALGELWEHGWRKLVLATLAAACAMFVYFWPILSAAPLENSQAFTRYTWLDSWR